MTEDEEILSTELKLHMRLLLKSDGTQKSAIEWMKTAYNLLERSDKFLNRPRIYSLPGSFGVPILMIDPPKVIELPPAGFYPKPPVWSEGKVIAYGDKYQNRAFTLKDSRKLDASALKALRMSAEGKRKGKK